MTIDNGQLWCEGATENGFIVDNCAGEIYNRYIVTDCGAGAKSDEFQRLGRALGTKGTRRFRGE